MLTPMSRSWPTDGTEPDPRWSLANERTLLAYERTALGLVVAGLAVAGSGSLAGAPRWIAALGLPLLLLGGAVALAGRRRFVRVQRAMRLGEDMPAPMVVSFLPWGVAAVAVVSAFAAALELIRRP